jgi:hypothetical protein
MVDGLLKRFLEEIEGTEGEPRPTSLNASGLRLRAASAT